MHEAVPRPLHLEGADDEADIADEHEVQKRAERVDAKQGEEQADRAALAMAAPMPKGRADV